MSAARGRGRCYIVACLQFDGSRRVERKPTNVACVCAVLPADAPESGWVKSAPFSQHQHTERRGGGEEEEEEEEEEKEKAKMKSCICVRVVCPVRRGYSANDRESLCLQPVRSLLATSRSAAGLLRVRK